MPETKDSEQTQWRIEEIGYDQEERLYFVLDDNRLYRRTDPPPPPPPKPKPKRKSRARASGARASKRRKVTDIAEAGLEEAGEAEEEGSQSGKPEEDDGFGGRKWECIAVTLTEYTEFLESIKKSKDLDEKALHKRLTDEVMPVIEKLEEERLKKIARRQREMLNLEKLATAKRSSRIASRQDREREEREAAEAERKRRADLQAAKKDVERQKHMEAARQSRIMTREQRLKEREYKRVLHEEELANLSEDSKKLGTGESKLSERYLNAKIEKTKKELEKLVDEEEWEFDCEKCGVHGMNIDDGSHSVSCDRCKIWQHTACLGISIAEAEKSNFAFVCTDCRRREEDSRRPKIPTLKFRLGLSSSPPSAQKKNEASQDGPSNMSYSTNGASSKTTDQPQMNNGTGLANGTTHSKHTNGQNWANHHASFPPTQSRNESQITTTSEPGSPTPSVSQTNGFGGHTSPVPNTTPSSSSHSPTQQLIPGKVSANRKHLNGNYLQHNTPNQHKIPYNSNPYHNSFDRQLPPPSSHSSRGLGSPLNNAPSMSPTQGNADVGRLVFPQSQNFSSLPSFRQTTPSLSPQKHSPQQPYNSSPPHPQPLMAPFVPGSHLPPSMRGESPILPSKSGLSPSKGSALTSPPAPGYIAGSAVPTVVPPVAQLSPTPRFENLHAPTKVMTPEQMKVAAAAAPNLQP